MSVETIRTYLESLGLHDRVRELEQSSATVELAAQALGCEPSHIAKTLSFLAGEQPVLIVAAGDAKVDNAKYKKTFHAKASMIKADKVEELTGYAPGGVCPFLPKEGVKVYLDESLKRFETVFPAAGTSNSAVRLHLDELEKAAKADGWVDVCKNWQ